MSSKAFFIYFFREINLDKKTKTKINSEIESLKTMSKNLVIRKYFDKNKEFFSRRNYNFLKFPYDITSISFFSKIINQKINQVNIRPYKLIILDCDNTLWGGFLDEDKNSEILYSNKNRGFYFQKFQSIIKELKNKGFLLSLCSKNNEKKVWYFMKKRKMILKKTDFILSKINWNEKAENIIQIVKNLNLRFEDCIY